MKRWLIIPGTLIICFQSYGQSDSSSFYLDEFNVSINRTFFLKGKHSGDRFGFGAGVYHSCMNRKKVNLTFGFEYNLSREFISWAYESHFSHSTDLTYSIHNLSIPLGIRLNIGSKTKIFIEAGTFLDLLISAKSKGTIHTYVPDENGIVVNKTSEFNGDANLSRSVNYGGSLGLGARIPFKKFELIVKPDYKLGLRVLDSYRTIIAISYIRLAVGLKRNN